MQVKIVMRQSVQQNSEFGIKGYQTEHIYDTITFNVRSKTDE